MKRNFRNKMKKIMAMVGIMCMLLSAVNVSSDAGVMPCGDTLIEEVRQS